MRVIISSVLRTSKEFMDAGDYTTSGRILSDKIQDCQSAEEYFNIYFSLASVYCELDSHLEALLYNEKAEGYKTSYLIIEQRAKILFSAGVIDMALENAEKAFEVAPSSMVRAKLRLYIKTIRETPANPFTILKISPTSDVAVIESAYKKLALVYHPDKNRNAGDKMRLFNSLFLAIKKARDQLIAGDWIDEEPKDRCETGSNLTQAKIDLYDIKLEFCHDYSNKGFCFRQACNYFHADKEEEAMIRERNGNYEPFLDFRRRLKEMRDDTQDICRDFTKSTCFRRFCTRTHIQLIDHSPASLLNFRVKHKSDLYPCLMLRAHVQTPIEFILTFVSKNWKSPAMKPIWEDSRKTLADYEIKFEETFIVVERENEAWP